MQRIAAPMVSGKIKAPMLSTLVPPAAFLLSQRPSTARTRLRLLWRKADIPGESIRRLAPNAEAAAGLLYWSAGSAVLNVAWEIAHAGLYRISPDHLGAVRALAIGHCVAGDVLVSALAYSLAAVAIRNWRWPVARPGHGSRVALGSAWLLPWFPNG